MVTIKNFKIGKIKIIAIIIFIILIAGGILLIFKLKTQVAPLNPVYNQRVAFPLLFTDGILHYTSTTPNPLLEKNIEKYIELNWAESNPLKDFFCDFHLVAYDIKYAYGQTSCFSISPSTQRDSKFWNSPNLYELFKTNVIQNTYNVFAVYTGSNYVILKAAEPATFSESGYPSFDVVDSKQLDQNALNASYNYRFNFEELAGYIKQKVSVRLSGN